MRATNQRRLYRRGKRGTFYLPLRIPANVLDGYPRGRIEIVVSLSWPPYVGAQRELTRFAGRQHVAVPMTAAESTASGEFR